MEEKKKSRNFAPLIPPHLSSEKDEVQQGGTFFNFKSIMKYNKQALDIPAQLAQLQQRGLMITDLTKAAQFLNNVSYFRFAAYLRPLEANAIHQFKAGSTFEQAEALYTFDAELRKILFAAIQRIEISLRSRVIHQFSLSHGPFWFYDASLTVSKYKFAENLAALERELKRTKEDFIAEHIAKYGDEDFPPAWKMLEVISFGTLTKLYINSSDTQAKKMIARSFDVKQAEVLESWMKSIVALRNTCAHHGRVWNRIMLKIPQLLNSPTGKWIINTHIDPKRFYAVACCTAYWLNNIDPTNTFIKDIKRLLRKYQIVDPAAMGFPCGWKKEPIWK